MKDIIQKLIIATIFLIGSYAIEEFKTTKEGTEYLIVFETKNWHAALKTCKERQMDLISIRSEDELISLQNMIEEIDQSTIIDRYWTSGTNAGNNNIFFWASNGKAVDSGLWHDDEPNNLFCKENCIELKVNDPTNSYRLNDVDCLTADQYFICTKKVDVDVCVKERVDVTADNYDNDDNDDDDEVEINCHVEYDLNANKK